MKPHVLLKVLVSHRDGEEGGSVYYADAHIPVEEFTRLSRNDLVDRYVLPAFAAVRQYLLDRLKEGTHES